jgi:hypothetical protein
MDVSITARIGRAGADPKRTGRIAHPPRNRLQAAGSELADASLQKATFWL